MQRSYSLFVFLSLPALSLPGFAHARVELTGAEITAGPHDRDCRTDLRLTGDEREQLREMARSLGNARRAERGFDWLRDHGAPGTAALADWLDVGAPGGEDELVERAIAWVVRCAPAERIAPLSSLVDLSERDILDALIGRMPVFSPEQLAAMHRVSLGDGRLGRLWVRLLVGAFKVSEARGVFPYVYAKTLYVKSPGAVLEHHLDAAVRLVEETDDATVVEAAVKFVAVYASRYAHDMAPWGRVLTAAIFPPAPRIFQESDEGDLESARRKAALLLGRSRFDGFEAALPRLAEAGQMHLLVEVAEGLEDRYREVDDSDVLDWLCWLRDLGDARLRREVRKRLGALRVDPNLDRSPPDAVAD